MIRQLELHQIDIIFIGNPNNPTGRLVARAELENLLAAALRYETTVLIDESFIDFLPEATDYSVRCLLGKYPNLVILHSLTKIYAIQA
jgi:threonine-phosphate decarboxylase